MTTTNKLRLIITVSQTAVLEMTDVNADENGESVLSHPGHKIPTQGTRKYVDAPWGYNAVLVPAGRRIGAVHSDAGAEGEVRRYQMRTHIEQLFTSRPARHTAEEPPSSS